MANKTRGRERLATCDSCGRTMPRDKTITFNKMNVYSTELRTADDVRTTTHSENHYCISCAKHRKIFEKLKNQAIRKAARGTTGDRFGNSRSQSEGWNSGKRG